VPQNFVDFWQLPKNFRTLSDIRNAVRMAKNWIVSAPRKSCLVLPYFPPILRWCFFAPIANAPELQTSRQAVASFAYRMRVSRGDNVSTGFWQLENSEDGWSLWVGKWKNGRKCVHKDVKDTTAIRWQFFGHWPSINKSIYAYGTDGYRMCQRGHGLGLTIGSLLSTFNI